MCDAYVITFNRDRKILQKLDTVDMYIGNYHYIYKQILQSINKYLLYNILYIIISWHLF